MRRRQAALSPGSLPDAATLKCETAIEKVKPNFTCFTIALLVQKKKNADKMAIEKLALRADVLRKKLVPRYSVCLLY